MPKSRQANLSNTNIPLSSVHNPSFAGLMAVSSVEDPVLTARTNRPWRCSDLIVKVRIAVTVIQPGPGAQFCPGACRAANIVSNSGSASGASKITTSPPKAAKAAAVFGVKRSHRLVCQSIAFFHKAPPAGDRSNKLLSGWISEARDLPRPRSSRKRGWLRGGPLRGRRLPLCSAPISTASNNPAVGQKGQPLPIRKAAGTA